MQHHGGLSVQKYVKALEEELRKIQVFRRELPLCLELVTQAIEACRQQLSGTTTEINSHGQSESSEQTTSNDVPPVFEEFFPIKRSASSDDDNEEHHSHEANTETVIRNDSKKKSDWLRSVQLWNNPTSDPRPKEDVPRKATDLKRNGGGGGGAFQPFRREKSVGKSSASEGKTPSSLAREAAPAVGVATTSSSAVTATGGSDGNDRREQREGQSERKQRRNWSPELHRRFLNALQQLGGSHAATPKQIRELMKVDGLTNDEVKSHLQKYRLHTRRPSPSIHNNGNPQPPQVVVVGGIWMPAPDYAAAMVASGEAAGVAAANGIYAPVAAPPPPPAVQNASASQKVQRLQHKECRPSQSQSEERFSHSGKRACSDSPATSSSTHTTTNSPVF